MIIYDKIPKTELNEFTMFFNMAKEDIVENKYELHSFISNEIEKVSAIVSAALNPVFNKMADEIKELDNNKIEKIIDFIKKK